MKLSRSRSNTMTGEPRSGIARLLARAAPWTSFLGAVTLLGGLSWDLAAHRLDPQLAAHEGILTLNNPSHVVLAVGIVLSVAGAGLFLLSQIAQPGHVGTQRGRAIGLTALLGALSLAGLALAAFGSALPGAKPHHVASAIATAHEESAMQAAHASASAKVAPVEAMSSQGQGSPESLSRATLSTHAERGAKAGAASPTVPDFALDHKEAPAVSAEEVMAAAKLLTSVKQGAARFGDFNVAVAEGYQQITPGRWVAHYHNQQYHTDGRIVDPERPEDLIYLRMSSGEMKLVGVMFLTPAGQPGPRVGGALTQWHSHNNLCFNLEARMVAGRTDSAGQCPPGTVHLGANQEMLHVWLVDNPNGVFANQIPPATLLEFVTRSGPN